MRPPEWSGWDPQRSPQDTVPFISSPLPLPIQFGLLPSLIPGQTLCPVFYVRFGEIPLYLTISASHEPHFSLLPLLLYSDPPLSPLVALKDLNIQEEEYSADLNGIAPFVDFWVPWKVAKRIIVSLGCEPPFWSPDGRRGILGSTTMTAVSWDEIGAVGHNWIPPGSFLPQSSYSLAALLNTPFDYVEPLPNEKCISTPMDPNRRATLVSEAESKDLTYIRHGEWGKIWDAMIRWNCLAWEEYLTYPSQPSSQKYTSYHDQHTIPHAIAMLLPLVPSLTTTGTTLHPSRFTPSPSDVDTAFRDAARYEIPSLWTYAKATLYDIWLYGSVISFITLFIPIHRLRQPETSFVEIERRRTRARVGLGVAEAISMWLIATYKAEEEMAVLRSLVESAGLECTGNLQPGAFAAQRATTPSAAAHSQIPRLSGNDEGPVTPVTPWDEARIEDLERRRRSSPPLHGRPWAGGGRDPEQDGLGEDSRPTSLSSTRVYRSPLLGRDRSRRRRSTLTTRSVSSPKLVTTTLPLRGEGDTAGGSNEGDDEEETDGRRADIDTPNRRGSTNQRQMTKRGDAKYDTDEEVEEFQDEWERLEDEAKDAAETVTDGLAEGAKASVLMSDKEEGWWVYIVLFGVVGIALIMGRIG